jgi:hypothetical protein
VATDRETEQERLDRIERLIHQLASASAQLQRELLIARQLATERERAARSHVTHQSKPARKKKR